MLKIAKCLLCPSLPLHCTVFHLCRFHWWGKMWTLSVRLLFWYCYQNHFYNSVLRHPIDLFYNYLKLWVPNFVLFLCIHFLFGAQRFVKDIQFWKVIVLYMAIGDNQVFRINHSRSTLFYFDRSVRMNKYLQVSNEDRKTDRRLTTCTSTAKLKLTAKVSCNVQPMRIKRKITLLTYLQFQTIFDLKI